MKLIRGVLVVIFVISEINYVLTHLLKTDTTGDHSKRNETTMCTNDECIMKCCAMDKYINTKLVFKGKTNRTKKVRFCDDYKETKDMFNVDRDFDKMFVKKPNLTIFEVKSGILEANQTLKMRNIAELYMYNFYMTQHAEVLIEIPNAYNRWTHVPNDMYCWDYRIVQDGTTQSLEPGVWAFFTKNEDETTRTSNKLMISAMLVSCFFLVLVLVVYALLPELRNLCGLILMAYVASLLGALLLLATLRIQKHETRICLGLSFLTYFFFLACFCWMKIMSFDIWWTFRSYAKARSIHRRGERFKFLMYCLYAWGLPLAMTIFLAVLNSVDMRDVPWFITPKLATDSCFFGDGEQFLYLYIPMLILILCNWIFYIMTAYNVWRLSRGTAVLDKAAAGTPQAHRTNRNRFLLYLKLSIVMGLNWVLEVVSFVYPDSSLWFISDFYNIFIGVSIFLIFVCKPNILRKLKKLFLKGKNSHSHPLNSTKSTTATYDSTASQETQMLPVCANPKTTKYAVTSI